MRKRLLYSTVIDNLKTKHILLIIGARQTGKTTVMNQVRNELKKKKKTTFFLTMEDKKMRKLLDQHPDNLFQIIPPINKKATNFIFIDEIQYLEDPTNFLKYHSDLNKHNLKFIVSGSSSFYIDEKFSDSMAGRKRLFELNSLSFEEFLQFKDREEFVNYLNIGKLPILYEKELQTLMSEYVIYGGYPEVVTSQNIDDKKATLKELANSYIKKDALEANLKNTETYFHLMRILAFQTGSLTNASEIGRDLKISTPTIEKYLNVMRKVFHISTIQPFSGNFSKEIRKMPKTYFNDLGLRNYFVRDFSPLPLRNDIGALFENFIFRRFLDNYDILDIQFWRTQKMQEVDFVIQQKKAFEVKFSEKNIKPKKYEYFQSKYPNINLEFLTFENVLSSANMYPEK
ncbi:MAG: ATP-binding protein [Bacteroidota bacterium]|nr:ATP-binding protein [Bacteroidota bacterium]